jgi:hypothetical protein
MATEEIEIATAEVPSAPVFGARKKARELATEVAELRNQLDHLGGLSVIELESRRDALSAEVAAQQQQIETDRAEAAAALEQQATDASAALKSELETAAQEKASVDRPACRGRGYRGDRAPPRGRNL